MLFNENIKPIVKLSILQIICQLLLFIYTRLLCLPEKLPAIYATPFLLIMTPYVQIYCHNGKPTEVTAYFLENDEWAALPNNVSTMPISAPP